VREQVAHGQLRLARLCELGPVARDRRVEVDRALVDEPVQRQRGESLRRRVDVHERVALERLRALLVAVAGPQVDDELAFERRSDRGSELVARRELDARRVAHAREARMTLAVDRGRVTHLRSIPIFAPSLRR
jgi:hypothetical protein